MGRKKIEMKMVRDTSSRQVTFSKRRNGLFKKANELATLCAAQVAIVVFSPGGKPFSFGHPNVNSVTQRFLNQENDKEQQVHVDEPNDGEMQELNQELTDLLKKLDQEKERGEELDKALKADREACKYKKPVNQLNVEELSNMRTSLHQLRENLKGRLSEIEASSSLLLLNEPSNKFDN